LPWRPLSGIFQWTKWQPTSHPLCRLARFVGADDRDGATALYQTEVIGLPSEMVEGMRQSGMWSFFTGLAHSLPYDYAHFEPGCPVPDDRLGHIAVPTLVIAGSNTFPWLATAAQDVSGAIPGANHLSLQGQDHGVLQQPESLLTCLRKFFG
jgi:pimeloyl-ACP methyl ester carboxylesterase